MKAFSHFPCPHFPPDRWVRASPGPTLCPKHIMAIRQAHLEEESVSRKLDWQE